MSFEDLINSLTKNVKKLGKEAKEYLNNEILYSHLVEISSVLLTLDTNDAYKIFGDIDALKLKSSMTLFYLVSGNEIFRKVLDKYYGGEMCKVTVNKISKTINDGGN